MSSKDSTCPIRPKRIRCSNIGRVNVVQTRGRLSLRSHEGCGASFLSGIGQCLVPQGVKAHGEAGKLPLSGQPPVVVPVLEINLTLETASQQPHKADDDDDDDDDEDCSIYFPTPARTAARIPARTLQIATDGCSSGFSSKSKPLASTPTCFALSRALAATHSPSLFSSRIWRRR